MRPDRGCLGEDSAGFTLLEALVALAVLGAVMATAYGVFSSGLHGLSRGDERLTLALTAESLLNRGDIDLVRNQPEASGDLPDGVSWRVTRTPYDLALVSQGLVVVEPPPPPSGLNKDLLNPDGQGQPGGGGATSSLGQPGGATGANGNVAGGGTGFGLSSSANAAGEPPSGLGGLAGSQGQGRQPGAAGADQPAKLRAYLLTAEVTSARGGSMVLSRLTLERVK